MSTIHSKSQYTKKRSTNHVFEVDIQIKLKCCFLPLVSTYNIDLQTLPVNKANIKKIIMWNLNVDESRKHYILYYVFRANKSLLSWLLYWN